ncbi:MAG: hypothetical protein JNK35_10795, partial [Phycisphaerae bacterium]|nr:hypothetical protein [Phycisphaerae bacterium]
MTTLPRGFTQAVLRGLPTLLTLAVLVAIAYLGHRYHWSLPSRASLTAAAPAREDWCMEHGVPESQCMICRGKTPVPDTEGTSLTIDGQSGAT